MTIDAYRKTATTLREREQELSLLVDMVPSHLWRLDSDGEPIFFNKRMVDFIGLDVADMDKLGMSRLQAVIETVIHPEDAARFRNSLSRCLVTGESFACRYRLRRADGVYRWMSSRAEPMRDEGGHIVQWYGLCHEIDDQMRAEEALRRSEQRLQELIDAVPIRIWSATPGGGPIYFNKRYQDYLRSVIANFDTLEDPGIETFVQKLIHSEDAPRVMRTVGNCFETGNGSVMRFRWREKDGVYRWAECRIEPRRDPNGRIVQWYGVSLDIDDEMRAQEALRQASDKLARAAQAASLAELSASIAHEVNQPLAAVMANSDACRRWLQSDPPNLERARATVEEIIRNANSAAEVVSRIRALFKHTIQARNRSSLEPVIAEVTGLVADLAAKNLVAIETKVEEDLPPIAFDRVQIQQILVNLMRNAVEAMQTSSGTRTLSVRACGKADLVQVEVSDTGAGIEQPEKIFDPFFTTKESGMGMGLAISRSIAESHGGRLWVEENKGSGATFIFTLPIEMPLAS